MTSRQLPTPQPMRQDTNPTDTELDLDAQIEALEQRLIAREAWLKNTAESLTHRAQTAMTPRPWVLPVSGAALVLWLGWHWWRRKEPVRQGPVEVHSNTNTHAFAHKHPAEKLADLPWAGLTALGWPLAPAAWRERLSPAGAVTVVSTALSIGRLLFQRRDR